MQCRRSRVFRISVSFVVHLLWIAHCSSSLVNVTTTQLGNISISNAVKPLGIHARAGLLFVGISTHDAAGASGWRAAQRATWLRWLTAKPRTNTAASTANSSDTTSPGLYLGNADSVVDPDGASYRYFLHSVPSAPSVTYQSSLCNCMNVST